MGLCKCERRRVSNLFCYDHRVNVCEFCLVTDHKRCIVKSYLGWVMDMNFSPTCSICQEGFNSDPSKECVRLLCFDIFHCQCLDAHLSQLPPTTTPAGYTCPSCDHPVIPPCNQGGPIAEALRNYLKTADWAIALESTSIISSYKPPTTTTSWSKSVTSSTKQQSTVAGGKFFDPKIDIAARQFLEGREDVDFPQSSQPPSKGTIITNSHAPQIAHRPVDLDEVEEPIQNRQQRDSHGYSRGGDITSVPLIDPFTDSPSTKYNKPRKLHVAASRWMRSNLPHLPLPRIKNRRILFMLVAVGILFFFLVNLSFSNAPDDSDLLLPPLPDSLSVKMANNRQHSAFHN